MKLEKRDSAAPTPDRMPETAPPAGNTPLSGEALPDTKQPVAGEAPIVGQGSPEGKPSPAGKKPVIVYIMILFIAAFLLMALSFAMHQRSNTEALGELQTSVSALREVQATQDKNILLQEELGDAQKELDALHETLAKTTEESAALRLCNQALL
ncbi:MAG: hypothetical protein RR288_02285, partial [Oscillibacter sp.]